MKTILITGANGFLGHEIANELAEEGHRLIGTCRTAKNLKKFFKIYNVSLGDPLEHLYKENAIDVVIHCANEYGPSEYDVNTNGTISWAEEARKHKVPMQIFLSSLSATPDAMTPYGRAKFEIEKWFIENNQVIIRPGLVLGDGGLFKKMATLIKKLPILPVIGASSLIYFTSIYSLKRIVSNFLRGQYASFLGKPLSIQQPKPILLIELLKQLCSIKNQTCVFFPVPQNIALLGVLMIERLGISKNINKQ